MADQPMTACKPVHDHRYGPCTLPGGDRRRHRVGGPAPDGLLVGSHRALLVPALREPRVPAVEPPLPRGPSSQPSRGTRATARPPRRGLRLLALTAFRRVVRGVDRLPRSGRVAIDLVGVRSQISGTDLEAGHPLVQAPLNLGRIASRTRRAPHSAPGSPSSGAGRAATSDVDHRASREAGWPWELPTATRSDYLSAYARITVSTTELPSASRAVVRSDAKALCPAGIVSLVPETLASRQVSPSS
jgi:hypothetical protein